MRPYILSRSTPCVGTCVTPLQIKTTQESVNVGMLRVKITREYFSYYSVNIQVPLGLLYVFLNFEQAVLIYSQGGAPHIHLQGNNNRTYIRKHHYLNINSRLQLYSRTIVVERTCTLLYENNMYIYIGTINNT